MLFGMVERGMEGEVIGDKGKSRAPGPTNDPTAHDGEEAMWAVILTKELWRKNVWCVITAFFHPTLTACPMTPKDRREICCHHSSRLFSPHDQSSKRLRPFFHWKR